MTTQPVRPILVTGGAGFIGSNFVRHWLHTESAPLINLDKLTYAGNLDSLADVVEHPDYHFFHGDVGDRQSVASLLTEWRPGAIIHFAAESHVDRSIDQPEAFVETNVVGTFRLLDAALDYWNLLSEKERQSFRFLHVSTDEVFGSLGSEGRFSETTPYAPNSPYAASKAAADHFAHAYYQTYGLPVLVTNCSNNYGPYQLPEKLIPLTILNALEGKSLPVYGDGQQVRDWIFVGDHCRGVRAVLRRGTPGETYNLGADCEKTNLEMVRTICDLVDQLRPDLPHTPCRRLIRFVEDRPGHDRRYAIDAGKAHQQLGWAPLETLASGLELTVAWYLANSDWVGRVRSGCYRDRQGTRGSHGLQDRRKHRKNIRQQSE